MCPEASDRDLIERRHAVNQASAVTRMKEQAARQAIDEYHKAGDAENAARCELMAAEDRARRADAAKAAGSN